jgi:hypothetical protein
VDLLRSEFPSRYNPPILWLARSRPIFNANGFLFAAGIEINGLSQPAGGHVGHIEHLLNR